jgi:hypothetical protein
MSAAADGMGGLARSLAFTALLEFRWFAKGSDPEGKAVTALLADWDAASRPPFWDFAMAWGLERVPATDWTRLADAELTHDETLARKEAEQIGLRHD